MPHDGQRSRTYAAEWAWRDSEHERETITSLAQARELLGRLLPPSLAVRTDVRLLTRLNTNDGGWVDYRGHGQYVLSLRLPTYPSIVIHEAAHVLTHACDAPDTHGAEYRDNLAWLVERQLGAGSARRLRRAFEREGL